jgi:aminopeptidase YwaD
MMKKISVVRLLAAAAGLVLAIGCTNYATIDAIGQDEQQKVDQVLAHVSQSRMSADLQAIETNQTTADNSAYRQTYPISELQAAGYPTPTHVSGVAYFGYDNFYVEVLGTDTTLRPVFIQAHFDRVWGSPAMDDNASGLVGALECARAIHESGVTFKHTIRVLFYDAEELGMVGSHAYVDTLTDAELPSFFINFEMIGYTAPEDMTNLLNGQPSGNWIGVYAPVWASQYPVDFANAASIFTPDLPYYATFIPANWEDSPIIDNLGRSDHRWFWMRNTPGLMITDGAELRNPNYHQPTDTFATLDLAFMTKVVKASLATALLKAEPVLP